MSLFVRALHSIRRCRGQVGKGLMETEPKRPSLFSTKIDVGELVSRLVELTKRQRQGMLTTQEGYGQGVWMPHGSCGHANGPGIETGEVLPEAREPIAAVERP
jgi:hypothetical protein